MTTAKALRTPSLSILGTVGLAALLRIWPLQDGLVAFSFDHGKDLLGVLTMWWTRTPALIGPWTSIPGLYFGPGWYYLLLPGLILSGGHPLSAAWTMALLGLLQVYLAYRWFGKWAGFLWAVSPAMIMTSTSAWNPFPMTLVMLVILKVWTDWKQLGPRPLEWRQALVLGSVIGLGFHFSSAAAVILLPLLAVQVVWRRLRLDWRSLVGGAVGLSWPFIPQAAFEVRHGFGQSRAIMAYVSGESGVGSTETAGSLIERLVMVAGGLVGELSLTLPTWWTPWPLVTAVGSAVIGIFFLATLWKADPTWIKEWKVELVVWTLGFWGWLSLMHFNYWYLYALFPLAVVVLARIMPGLPRNWQLAWVVLWLVASLSLLARYSYQDQANLKASRIFLPNKIEAVNWIRAQAAGQPFAVYHYQPDIYDYAYQYLWFWQAGRGRALPTEFSYQAGESSYIPKKSLLLEQVADQATTEPAIFNFYIVEEAGPAHLLEEWQDRQVRGPLLAEQRLADDLVVYQFLAPQGILPTLDPR